MVCTLQEALQGMDAAAADRLLRAEAARATPALVALVMQKHRDRGDPARACALLLDFDRFGEAIAGFPFRSPEGRRLRREMLDAFCKSRDRDRALRTVLLLAEESGGDPEEVLRAVSCAVDRFLPGPMDLPLILVLERGVDTALAVLAGTQPLSDSLRLLVQGNLYRLLALAAEPALFREKAAAYRRIAAGPLSPERAALVRQMDQAFCAGVQLLRRSDPDCPGLELLCAAAPAAPAQPLPAEVQQFLRVQALMERVCCGEESSPQAAADRRELLGTLCAWKQNKTPVRENYLVMLVYLLLNAKENPALRDRDAPELAAVLPEFRQLCMHSDLDLNCEELLCLTLQKLQLYYAGRGEDAFTLLYSADYLRCSCDHYKRILAEAGAEAFADALTDGVEAYSGVVRQAFSSLERTGGLGLTEALYLQMSRHKNLMYMAEMRLHSGTGPLALLKLQGDDYLLRDLARALPEDAVLADFFYVRRDPEARSFRLTEAEKRRADCYAFTLDHSGTVRWHWVGNAAALAAYLAGPETPGSYAQYLCRRAEWEAWMRLQRRQHPDGRLENGRDADARRALAAVTAELLRDYGQKKRIFAAAEGDWNNVSFLSLPWGSGFIADRFAVRNIACAYDLVHPRPPAGENRALVLSAPEYGFGERNLPYLNGSEQEGLTTAFLLGQAFGLTVDSLSCMDATREKLLELLGKHTYRILHFSTHGDIENGRMCMALTGANESEQGLLWDHQLAQALPRGADAAVLSLCFAGKSDAAAQNSLGGFIRSMLLSGVGAVVAPVSTVGDAAAMEVTAAFYQKYLGEGLPAEVALQQAVVQLRGITQKTLKDTLAHREALAQAMPFTQRMAREVSELTEEDMTDIQLGEPEEWMQWVCYSAAADPAPAGEKEASAAQGAAEDGGNHLAGKT